jgi:hypothetical protein
VEVLVGLAILAALWPFLAPELWPGDWVREQVGSRPAKWAGAIRLARERPVRGQGVGAFAAAYARVHPRAYAAHRHRSDVVETAHCLPLHVLVETGVVGLGLAGWLAFQALRVVRRAGRKSFSLDAVLLRGAVCGAVAMLVQGVASTSLHQVGCSVNLVLVLALIGGLGNVWWRRRALDMGPTLLSVMVTVGVAVLIVTVYAATAGRGLMSEVYKHQGRTTEGLQDATESYEKSLHWGWTSYASLDTRQKLAGLYERSGRPEPALEQLERIDTLAPNYGIVRRNEAVVRLQLEDLAGAADAIASYCRKDLFDKTAYKIWQEILAAAVARGRPHLARPREAVRLLREAQAVRTRQFQRVQVTALQKLEAPFLRVLETSGPEAAPPVTPPPDA